MHLGAATVKDIDPYDDYVSTVDSESDSFQGETTFHSSNFWCPPPTTTMKPTRRSIHRRSWSLPKRVPKGKTHDSVLLKIYYSLLRDCSWRVAWNDGVTIQAHQWKSGVDPASHFCVSLLNFYATYGFPNSAHLVFVEMLEHGAVSWTTSIPSFMARGNGWDGTQVQADATQVDFFSVKEVLWCMLRIQQGYNKETTNIFYLLRHPGFHSHQFTLASAQPLVNHTDDSKILAAETVCQNYVNSFLMSSSCLPQDFDHYLLLHAYNSEIVGKDSVAEQILKGMLINLSTCLETVFPICSVSYSPVTNIWENFYLFGNCWLLLSTLRMEKFQALITLNRS